MLQVFETATRLLMYHAFGLCIFLGQLTVTRQALKIRMALISEFFSFRAVCTWCLFGHPVDGGCDPIGGLRFWRLDTLRLGVWRTRFLAPRAVLPSSDA